MDDNTQFLAPVSPTTQPPAKSQLIDITPGREEQPLHTPSVSHIDNASIPPHPVEDLTQMVSSPNPIPAVQASVVTPETPLTSPLTQVSTPEATAAPTILPQNIFDADISPASALNAVIAATPAPVVEVTPQPTPVVVKEEAPAPVTGNAGQDTSPFKINSTSPLFEDPDTVKLIK